MPSIGDNFDDVDIQDRATYTPFLAAIRERSLALGGYVASPAPVTPVAVGADVQAVTFWVGLQQQVSALYEALTGRFFLKPGYNPSGQTAYLPTDPFDVNGEGDPTMDDDDGVSAARYLGLVQAFEAAGNPGWTRKRPREIASPTAPCDTFGNVPQPGHRAFCLAGGAPPVPTPEQIDPFAAPHVYEFDGAAWVPADPADGPADLLSSGPGDEREISGPTATTDTAGRIAQPGMLARGPDDNIYLFSAGVGGSPGSWGAVAATAPDIVPSGGSGIPAGPVQAGDYIGPWLLADLAEMIRALGNRTRDFVQSVRVGQMQGSTGGTRYATPTAAIAAAEAAWATGSAIGAAHAWARLTRHRINSDAAERYSFEMSKLAQEMYVRTAAHRPRSVAFGAAGFRIHFGLETASAITPIDDAFDDQGSDLSEQELTIFHSDSLAAGVPESSRITFPDDLTTQPTTKPDSAPLPPPQANPFNPNTSQEVRRGFYLGGHFCVVTWDFEYT